MVANWTEKELEDWLWQHPEAIGEGYQHVARQVPAGKGRADIVGVYTWTDGRVGPVLVIELKAHEAIASDLLQLIRYTEVLQAQLVLRTELGEELVGIYKVEGMLIAPAFEDEVRQTIHSSLFYQLRTVEQAFLVQDDDVETKRQEKELPVPSDRIVAALRKELAE